MAGEKGDPTVNEKMTAIANAIRDKTGGTEALTLDDMASGVNDVYEAGKQAEQNEFFENYTAFALNPARTGHQCTYLFAGVGWNDKTFRPTKDMVVVKNANYMFSKSQITDLEAILEEQGVVLDLSKAPRVDSIFSYCTVLKKVPVLDFSKATVIAFDYAFNRCEALHTIRKLILPINNLNNSNLYYGMFSYCNSLVNIEIEGLITKNISFSYSPLSVESMKSIITHLQDYSGTTSEFNYKVTFSSACKTALEAEGNTSPNGNTWLNYMTDLGWNH